MAERTSSGRAIDSGAAALWASAMVIAAMILVQAGRHGAGSQAHAETVSQVGDLTALTARSGGDNDVLAVLDGRAERLMLYTIEGGGRSVELHLSEDLSQAFMRASGRSR